MQIFSRFLADFFRGAHSLRLCLHGAQEVRSLAAFREVLDRIIEMDHFDGILTPITSFTVKEQTLKLIISVKLFLPM